MKLTLETTSDGFVAYIKISDNAVIYTSKYPSNNLWFDYDSDNNLVGIELIGPSPVLTSDIVKLLDDKYKAKFLDFADKYVTKSVLI